MKDKLHHVVYITFLNGSDRFYVGKHSTNDLDDGYVGSGRWIEACKRRNREFRTEIIWEFSSSDAAYKFEEELVSKLKSKHPDRCMNLCSGGRGGIASGDKLSQKTRLAMSQSRKGKPISDRHSEQMRKVALTSEKHKAARLKLAFDKRVWVVCMNTGTVHHGILECSKFWGISTATVHGILTGKRGSKKYKFEYLDGDPNV
jgi:hypothetical protein